MILHVHEFLGYHLGSAATDRSHHENSRLSIIKQLEERVNFIHMQRERITYLWGPESDIHRLWILSIR